MSRTPNLLDAMTHARLCADSLTAAYYLGVGRASSHVTSFKERAGDDQFRKLAASLGYRIEKIEAPAEREEAAA